MLLISTCGKLELNPDPSLPSTDANYPTGEFKACNRHWHGLGVCLLEAGSYPDLEIQTYYNGTLSYNFDGNELQSQTYKDSEPVKINVPHGTKVVSFLVTPYVPKQIQATYSLKGYVYYKEKKRDTSVTTQKVPWNRTVPMSVFVGDEKEVDYFVYGCGNDKKGSLTANGKFVSIDVVINESHNACIVTGGVKSTTLTKEVVGFFAPYDPRYVPLAIPSVESNTKSITVNADPTVSFICIDSHCEIGNKITFKFKTEPKFIRIATVKGRSVVGINNGGNWEWLK